MRSGLKILFAVAITAFCTSSAFADNVTGTNSTVIEWGTATNPTGDIVPVTAGAATLSPSDITIAHTVGEVISDVNVTLLGGAHTFADDLEIALAYNGVVVELMNDAGGGDDVAGDLTFDDEAAAAIDDVTGGFATAGGSGTFQVSVYNVGTNNPAATGTVLADFNGLDGNGVWSLFVFDDAGGDTGSFAGGWSLNVVTVAAVPEPAAVGFLAFGALALISRRRRS